VRRSQQEVEGGVERPKRLDVVSIFFGEHDRNHTLGHHGIGRIAGAAGQGRVVIIDLEKDRVTVDFERAEIVLFMRIVLMAEIIVHRDGLKDSRYRFVAKSGNPHHYDGGAIVATQMTGAARHPWPVQAY
jgi:hypothetical protein